MRTRIFPLAAASTLLLAACQKTQQAPAPRPDTPARTAPAPAPAPRTPARMEVTSPAFAAGRPIPRRHAYTGEGENVSPPLAWSGAPPGTVSLALICEDPDAPSPRNPRPEPWVHWVLYDLPHGRASLAEGETGAGVAGKNDFGETAYGGPLPPPGSGAHRYFFRVFALDRELDLPPGATRKQVLEAMQDRVLGKGEISGTYER
jgi:Raf kinase inhibitor-like YbhB/YbcL family protein